MMTKPSFIKEQTNRRDFIKTAGLAASAATLAGATSVLAQAAAKPVTLAFVGCAHIHTPGFINLLKSRPDVKVKYVWDHDEARAQRRATELGAKVASLAEIWADAEIPAVVICSETNRHKELVLAAVQAKKHLFAEKPLAGNSKESYEMAEAIRNVHGRLRMTIYPNVLHNSWETAYATMELYQWMLRQVRGKPQQAPSTMTGTYPSEE